MQADNMKTLSWLNVCPIWHCRMANYTMIWTKHILISLTQETLIMLRWIGNMALEHRINYCAMSKLVA